MERKEMLRRLKVEEKAIDISIAKWKEINNGFGGDEGCENCALCSVYYIHQASYEKELETSPCIACPLYRYRHSYGCLEGEEDTPYDNDAEDMLRALEDVKQWMIDEDIYKDSR